MSNLKYWIWLSSRKGLAGQSAMRVLNYFGSPERAYFSDKDEYALIEGLSDNAAKSLLDKSLDQANRILGDCDRLDLRIMTMQDSMYPERLSAIHQPPLVLYMKGRQIAFDEEAAVAIVGTRDATPYGTWVAAQLSMDLTKSGALIVSGMAEGIDAAAIRGALKAGGPVVSVLAGGLDVVYPREHRFLYEDVAAAGTLISEHPPGTNHLAGHFPIRNRLISGLSVGVVAVESKRYGGTLHTVGHALDQDRDVFAVPGPIGAESSEGTNRLIQEGAAKLILNAEDVVCELIDRFPGRLRRVTPPSEADHQRINDALDSMDNPNPPAKKQNTASPTENSSAADTETSVVVDWNEYKIKLTDDQQTIFLAMRDKNVRADDIVELTQIPARRVLSALTILQIQGLVKEESGKRFRAAVRLKME